MLLVVRRSAIERFRLLQQLCAGEPIEIIWDRRQAERRGQRPRTVAIERRRGDRREVEDDEPLEPLDERRSSERRQRVEARIPERRRGERRGPAPESWSALDFVLVRGPRPRQPVVPDASE